MDISSDFYDNLELKPSFKKRKREEAVFDKAHLLIPDILGEAAVIYCSANSGKKYMSYSQILFI